MAESSKLRRKTSEISAIWNEGDDSETRRRLVECLQPPPSASCWLSTGRRSTEALLSPRVLRYRANTAVDNQQTPLRRNSALIANLRKWSISGRPLLQMEDRWTLTTSERDLLRRTWSDELDFLFQLGSDIFQYIFDNEPIVRTFFPALAQYDGDRRKESAIFKGHALKFVQVLSQATRHSSDLSRLDPQLYRVGEQHLPLMCRGFKPTYWEVFRSAIVFAMRASIERGAAGIGGAAPGTSLSSLEERHAAIEVWRRMADYIVCKMRIGFNAAVARRQSASNMTDGNSSNSDV